MNNPTITRVPPPMRGIKQAVEEIKARDPDSALTYNALRKLVLTGEIPHVKVGPKYLVNLNTLYKYLNDGTVTEQPQAYNSLRIIKE